MNPEISAQIPSIQKTSCFSHIYGWQIYESPEFFEIHISMIAPTTQQLNIATKLS